MNKAALRTKLAGIAITELTAQFDTPFYLYDQAVIQERIAEFAKFDVIRYAQKACSNLAVLDLMRRQGVMLDAVSAGEIHRAIQAGYATQGNPPPIVYTADIFDRDSLKLCVEHGLHVNAGSPDMLSQLGELLPGSHVTLRINPGFGHGHSQKTNTGGPQSKHGIWHEQVDECLLAADRHGLFISGLHMHIGSGTDLKHLSQVADAMTETAQKVGRSITTISCGGGIPVPYHRSDERIDIDAYFQLWHDRRKQLEDDFGHAVQLEIEPGRYLVAESGYLVTEIRAIKTMGENRYYLVDAGFNNLARPILYGAYHPISIAAANGRKEDRPTQPVVVGGPLCESGDIFTQTEGGFVAPRELPAASVGDYLIIEVAGAYGFVMSSNYNSKPFAAEILVRDGHPHLVRRRQTSEELTQGEVIPAG